VYLNLPEASVHHHYYGFYYKSLYHLQILREHTHTHKECTVEYDGLRHRWVRKEPNP